MPLKIIRADITKLKVDAIVNAANVKLRRGGGVCGAIFSAAGAAQLQAECDSIGSCQAGEAVITQGYNLPARYIIHTVGPIWKGGSCNEAQLLHNSYKNSLALALKYKCRSVAFPLISSGIYGYPKDQALQIAIAAISEFLLIHEMEVYLIVFDKDAVILSEKLFSAIDKYIDDNYAAEHMLRQRGRVIEPDELQVSEERLVICSSSCLYTPVPKGKRNLEDVVDQLEESFSQMLLRMIDEKGMTDVETYKRANIDRKLFSKIRSRADYNPSKATAIAFAIALRLNLDETRDLLGKAGYTLSRSSKSDLIVEYFIGEGNFNIHEINEALFAFDQNLLGA